MWVCAISIPEPVDSGFRCNVKSCTSREPLPTFRYRKNCEIAVTGRFGPPPMRSTHEKLFSTEGAQSSGPGS
jgi:hypothetical protein